MNEALRRAQADLHAAAVAYAEAADVGAECAWAAMNRLHKAVFAYARAHKRAGL